MILTEIKFLIGVHLGEKGFPPAIVAPVLNTLSLIEEELIAVGYDFSNPEIEKEIDRLRMAIVKWNWANDEVIFTETPQIIEQSVLLEQALNLKPATLPSLFTNKKEDDSLAWLDDEEEDES